MLGVLDKFENKNAVKKTMADIAPQAADFIVDVATNVLLALDAFTGAPYPFTLGADPCPSGLSRRGDSRGVPLPAEDEAHGIPRHGR